LNAGSEKERKDRRPGDGVAMSNGSATPPSHVNTARPPTDDCTLLHRGGTEGAWGNLGLWSDGADYAAACRALALAVGRAAGLQAGDRVLAVACGSGAELPLWIDDFGAASVLGIEHDARRAAEAQAAHGLREPVGSIQVLHGDAMDTLPPALARGGFDAVLCVDAAYHLSPRSRWLTQTHRLLRPGGRLAYTDLVLDGQRARAALLHRAARACGVPWDDLADDDGQRVRLQQAGFTNLSLQRLDDPVLGGFARHVRRQSWRLGSAALGSAWRRPLATALLIPPCRAAGLGYALWSAHKPPAG
jgi:SAM-dependent methyltransferase